MRRSFGGGGGRNMGGGGMIRTVHRALRTGVGGPLPEPLSCSGGGANSRTPKNFNEKHSSSAPTALTLSSSSSSSSGVYNNNNNGTSAFSSLINFPLSSSSSSVDEESEWECVDGIEEGRAVVFSDDYYNYNYNYNNNNNDDVFGSVPSTEEVNHAVSALRQAFAPWGAADVEVSSEMDWMEPSPRFRNSQMLQLYGPDTSVYDAFHLMETEPCVQRMVISLSSDKAVWEAVLNNEVVRELRGSISEQADGLIEEFNSDDSNPMKDILSWIVVNGKAKIMQVVDSIRKLVHEAFKGQGEGESEREDGACADPFQEKLKTSLLLSVMVLIIVVITRTTKMP